MKEGNEREKTRIVWYLLQVQEQESMKGMHGSIHISDLLYKFCLWLAFSVRESAKIMNFVSVVKKQKIKGVWPMSLTLSQAS